MSTDPEVFAKFQTIPEIIADWTGNEHRAILDFGCGSAITAVAMALRYPDAQVIAVDLETSREMCLGSGIREFNVSELPPNLEIRQVTAAEPIRFPEKFDLIYSWSTFEHVSQDVLPAKVANLLENLAPDGQIFTQIAPLYYSPFGSHLSHLLPEPWIHLTLQQNLFYDRLARACSTPEQYEAMYSLYNTLNRITPQKLAELLSPLELVRSYFSCNENYGSFYFLEQGLKNRDLQSLTEVYRPEMLLTEQVVYLHRGRE